MIDYKSRASGETLETSETLPEETRLKPPLNDFSVVQKALLRLQSRSLMTLSADETDVWLEDLAKIQPWKLARIDEHTGHMRDVWKFFEQLQYTAPFVPRIVDNSEHAQEVYCIGKELVSGVKEITLDESIPCKGKAIEAFMQYLREKYPQHTF